MSKSSPFEPPKCEGVLSSVPLKQVTTTQLVLCFSGAFGIVSSGNHFAIFWGAHSFAFWTKRNYLGASLVIEGFLLALAVLLATIAAWSFPRIPSINLSGLKWMLVLPFLLAVICFTFLKLIGLPDEQELCSMLGVLCILQTIAIAVSCRKMIVRWQLTAFLALVGAFLGCVAGLLHTALNALTT